MKNTRSYKEYIELMERYWIDKNVLFEGNKYKVVGIDYNGGLLIDKQTQYNDTTAVATYMVKETY